MWGSGHNIYPKPYSIYLRGTIQFILFFGQEYISFLRNIGESVQSFSNDGSTEPSLEYDDEDSDDGFDDDDDDDDRRTLRRMESYAIQSLDNNKP